jgi:hypothetical protein
MNRLLFAIVCLVLTSCSTSKMPGADESAERLVNIFDQSARKASGAYCWEWLREDIPAWKNLKYEWIASSSFQDQIILTENSPIHDGLAVYLLGPDIAGPVSDNPIWPDNLIYLGSSIDEWLARIERFGDEYAVVPGSIDELLENPDEYRKIYRDLNPGLTW